MNKKTSEEYNIESDKYIRDSGVQGGKITGEKLALGCFIIGIPMLTIGMWSIFNMLFGFGFPMNMATIILVLLAIVIGLLLIIGGYTIYRAKHVKN
jgi:uncharacterized membrane protein